MQLKQAQLDPHGPVYSMKKYLPAVSVILFTALPVIVNSMQLLDRKGAVVTGFYFLYAISLLLLPLLFLRPNTFAIILFPFALLVPAELIHIQHYDGYSTLSAFISVITTDYNEAGEFYHNYRHYFFIFYPVLAILAIGLFRSRNQTTTTPASIKMGILSVFILSLGAFTTKAVLDLHARGEQLPGIKGGLRELYTRLFHQNFPYSYLLKTYEVLEHRIRYNKSIEYKKNFTFGATADQNELLTVLPIHVLVIGETSRAANWQLSGYPRSTNPRLSHRSNLTYFNNTITAATHTRESIQLVLTRATPGNTFPINHEKSIVTAFSEAGYKTIWISNQNMTGGVDTEIYPISQEAEQTFFLGGDYNENSIFDAEIIPLLDEVLDSNRERPLFIVIHTMGSHERYKMRYPTDFEEFRPASRGDDYNFVSKGIRERLINSYDNSILYTDYVLDQIISRVANSDRAATVTYFSDHGENILDDGTSRFGHGGVTPTRYVTDVPLLLWTSPRFRSIYPDKTQHIEQNRNKPVSVLYLFDTLLDIGRISIHGYHIKNSLAGNDIFPKKRFILNTELHVIEYADLTDNTGP